MSADKVPGVHADAKFHDEVFEVPVELLASKSLCACGKSSALPFCDGSHRVTQHRPVGVNITKDGKALIKTRIYLEDLARQKKNTEDAEQRKKEADERKKQFAEKNTNYGVLGFAFGSIVLLSLLKAASN